MGNIILLTARISLFQMLKVSQASSNRTIRFIVISLFLNFFPLQSVISQIPSLPEGPVSVHATLEPLDSLLKKISTVTGVHFAYSPDRIHSDQKVTLEINGKPLREVLDTLCHLTKCKYHVKEGSILLIPAKEMNLAGRKKGIKTYSLTGTIRDNKSHELLPGGTIFIPSIQKGTVSNSYGFFSITLPVGTYKIRFSYLGYKPVTTTVVLNNDIERTIDLATEPASLREIIVPGLENAAALAENTLGNIRINPASIDAMPSLLGEKDVIKSLEIVPGIRFFGDGSTFFFVRGGNRDQNLIRIDDAPVYNPSHILGVFSTVIPEAVKSIKIYKGFFPADIGERLSSVVDIRTKDGSMTGMHMEGSAGIVSARLSVQGPVKKDKSSFFLAGRRSYFQWLLSRQNPSLKNLHFYDFNGKYNNILNEKNRLYFSLYSGHDLYKQQGQPGISSGITWGNISSSFRWNHLFNPRLFANTTLYGGSYDYDLVSSFENNISWHSHVANFGIKTDLGYYTRPGNKIKTGMKVSGHNFNPGNIVYHKQVVGGTFPIVPIKNTMNTSLYVLKEQKITPGISCQYGLRLNGWFNMGDTWEYRYNEDLSLVDSTRYPAGKIYHSTYSVEPRFSFTVQINRNSYIRAGYSLTTQYMHMITNSISPFSSFEIWVPAGPNLRPQQAHQVHLGYFRFWPAYDLRVSIDGYLKSMNGQVDYIDHANLLLNPYFEQDLRQGKTQAGGIEILIQKEKGKLNGWISYTFSRAIRKTPGINGGHPYPAYFDRPHELTASVNWLISRRWNMSGNWIVSSGAPYSSPTAFFSYDGYTVPWYDKKNNERYPFYSRMDMSVTFHLNKKPGKFKHDLTFSLFNISGRKNPYELNFNKMERPDGKLVVPDNFFVQPELIYTQMYLFRTIPSLTYHFKM